MSYKLTPIFQWYPQLCFVLQGQECCSEMLCSLTRANQTGTPRETLLCQYGSCVITWCIKTTSFFWFNIYLLSLNLALMFKTLRTWQWKMWPGFQSWCSSHVAPCCHPSFFSSRMQKVISKPVCCLHTAPSCQLSRNCLCHVSFFFFLIKVFACVWDSDCIQWLDMLKYKVQNLLIQPLEAHSSSQSSFKLSLSFLSAAETVPLSLAQWFPSYPTGVMFCEPVDNLLQPQIFLLTFAA